MFTEQVSSTPEPAPTKHAPIHHPLAPLTSSEIIESSDFIRQLYPAETRLSFKTITLSEPAKAQLAPYLDAEHHGRAVGNIDRKAFVNYYIKNTV
jgi:primary-amine oxidase